MTKAMSTPHMGGLYSHPVGVRDSTNEQTDIRTNERDEHHQDQGENRRVPYAAGPVDKGSFVAWFDRELTASEASVCLARTRALLEKMQAQNEHRAAQLNAAGLTSFPEMADWLMDHWSKDQKIAWHRRWERLGLTDPDPHLRRVHVEHSPQPTRPCERCGIHRVVRVGRLSPLCADCRFVLSKEEIALWVGKKVAA